MEHKPCHLLDAKYAIVASYTVLPGHVIKECKAKYGPPSLNIPNKTDLENCASDV